MSEDMNTSATDTQENLSDEQKFYNLLDSESATPTEDDRADAVEETAEVEEAEADYDDSEVESDDAVEDGEEATEPTDQVEEITEEDEEYIFNVKVDGEELEVNQDELIKGYQRQSDYTRKAQALAEERKAFELQQQEMAQERNRLLQLLEQNQSNPDDKYKNVNWEELREYEPEKYLLLREEQRQDQMQDQIRQQELQRQQAAQQEEQNIALQRYLADEDAKLVDRIEGWAEAETKKQIQSDIASYAKSIGYTDEELGHLADSRALELMWKARQWDESQTTTKKVAAKKKSKAVKRVAKGGQPKSKSQVNAKRVNDLKSRAKQTGSVDDAAAAFYEMM